MKKVVLTVLIMLVGLSSFANNSNAFKKIVSENVSIEEPQNMLSIDIEENGNIQTYEFGFETLEELQNFEVDFVDSVITYSDDLECSVSITVKVRVGFDSNFVEASATMSGISCSDVVSAIRGLKAQLLAGIK